MRWYFLAFACVFYAKTAFVKADEVEAYTRNPEKERQKENYQEFSWPLVFLEEPILTSKYPIYYRSKDVQASLELRYLETYDYPLAFRLTRERPGAYLDPLTYKWTFSKNSQERDEVFGRYVYRYLISKTIIQPYLRKEAPRILALEAKVRKLKLSLWDKWDLRARYQFGNNELEFTVLSLNGSYFSYISPLSSLGSKKYYFRSVFSKLWSLGGVYFQEEETFLFTLYRKQDLSSSASWSIGEEILAGRKVFVSYLSFEYLFNRRF